MSDRLSQLQDQVNNLATLFCDATGYLQGHAKPSKFENFAENLKRDYENEEAPAEAAAAAAAAETNVEDVKTTFAQLITSTAKKIDTLIDSLPNEEETNEQLLAEQLRELELENAIAARQLEFVTECAENLLTQLQEKISKISESQLKQQSE
jgi:hypothetical protein